MKVKFEREKETRNTIKYHEVAAQGTPPIIGTLYLQKWFAGDCKERLSKNLVLDAFVIELSLLIPPFSKFIY